MPPTTMKTAVAGRHMALGGVFRYHGRHTNSTPPGGWNVGVDHLPTLRIVGPGRAGLSLSRALAAAGWGVLPPLGRGDDLSAAAAGADLLVLATPDGAVAGGAAPRSPVGTTV